MQLSKPRGVIAISQCLSVKGAEAIINKAHSFEISTQEESNYYVADTDKVFCPAYVK